MFPIGLTQAIRPLGRLRVYALLALLPLGVNMAAAAPHASLDDGYRQMYNLDFAGAHQTFEIWQQQHPDNPLGPASNAAAYLFGEFERMRILELDLFANNKNFEQQTRLTPDAAVRAAFDQQLDRADALANKILSESSADRDALFARVLTDGLRGDYAALIERKNKTALSFLKSSRSLAEKLLKIDPEYHDAHLALGIENYLLGLKSAPARWGLRLSGAQTSKEKGLNSIRITAEKGRYLAPYARLLLVIAALRDEDKNTAREILTGLSMEFPRNRLYRLELDHLS